MEEKELKAKDIPWEYALCFNSECENKDKCMHYQARLLMSEDRYYGAGCLSDGLGERRVPMLP